MELTEQLENLAEEELCIECYSVLTDDEKEIGYVCRDCIGSWCESAFHDHTRHSPDDPGI